MVYNKLVRDKIPELILRQGQKPVTRVLDSAAYLEQLEIKLDEEVAEYHADKSLEELADILEVVYALCEANGYNRQLLMEEYDKKHEARGGFSDRIFLIANEG